MFSKKLVLACTAAAAFSFGGVAATQAVTVVNSFGDNGWYSSDTRDSSGTNLFGQYDTHPELNTKNGGFVAGDDAKIAQRIAFVDGPAGSLNGKGAVKLNATDENAGKANLSVFDATTGFGTGSALLDQSFGVSYRYYDEPVPTTRTLGVSISLTDNNSNTSYYTLSYAGTTPHSSNVWIDESADQDSLWRLYGNGVHGAAPGGSKSQSLTDWSLDSTFGDILSSNYTIYEVGFNLGSYQRNENTYVDWFQSNLINGGEVVDFQAPVPEPASIALLGLGGLALLARRRRRSIA